MAMRPRRLGTGFIPRGPQQPIAIGYDTFQPNSEWKDEDDASLLLVYLPGFLREQISHSINDSARLIRVQGQRTQMNVRFIRFDKSYGIPENCSMTGIKFQFDSGILTIRIPKIVPEKTVPDTTGQEASPSRPQEAANETEQAITSQKEALTNIVDERRDSEKDVVAESQKGQEEATNLLQDAKTEVVMPVATEKLEKSEEMVIPESGVAKEKEEIQGPTRKEEESPNKIQESTISESAVAKAEKDKEEGIRDMLEAVTESKEEEKKTTREKSLVEEDKLSEEIKETTMVASASVTSENQQVKEDGIAPKSIQETTMAASAFATSENQSVKEDGIVSKSIQETTMAASAFATSENQPIKEGGTASKSIQETTLAASAFAASENQAMKEEGTVSKSIQDTTTAASAFASSENQSMKVEGTVSKSTQEKTTAASAFATSENQIKEEEAVSEAIKEISIAASASATSKNKPMKEEETTSKSNENGMKIENVSDDKEKSYIKEKVIVGNKEKYNKDYPSDSVNKFTEKVAMPVNSEENQIMLNLGVVFLVLMAIGSYILWYALSGFPETPPK